MTTFASDQHPRVADGTFTQKQQTPADFALTDEQIPAAWIVRDTPSELVGAHQAISAVRDAAARAETDFQQKVATALRAFVKTRWPSAQKIHFAADGDRPNDMVTFGSIEDEFGGNAAQGASYAETASAMEPYTRLITNPYNEGDMLEQDDAYGESWVFDIDPEA
jgi:hypothetical protein